MADLVSIIEQGPCLYKGSGVSAKLIEEAEVKLGVKFSSEYRKYLAKFGYAAVRGCELTGLGAPKAASVVEVTENARSRGAMPDEGWYVVEEANIDGIFVWQDAAGRIFQLRPGGDPVLVAASLAEYLAQ